jgi:hypothetical protein
MEETIAAFEIGNELVEVDAVADMEADVHHARISGIPVLHRFDKANWRQALPSRASR